MNKLNINKSLKNHSSKQVQPPPAAAAAQVRSIKLGIDVHADFYVVVRIVDGSAAQPAQRFSPAGFLHWCVKQKELAQEVYACYEAGPFGYSLHRRLEQMGVVNYVVRPRDWDQYGQRVKTDQRDAAALAECLDRYVAGNRRAFGVVRVPTPEQEQRRSLARQRESLQKQKQRLAAQGRSHALYYGRRLKGEWWRPRLWEKARWELPAIVVNLLEPLRRLIEAVETELAVRTTELQAAAPPALPLGLGRLTAEILEREVADWRRFSNRKEVASYTGLCPTEDSSGRRRFQGSINKCGNRRLRTALIEGMWRLTYFQPGYRGVKKWSAVLGDATAGPARRKKAIVALARIFAVDWWRVRTGRCRAQDLGLQLRSAM